MDRRSFLKSVGALSLAPFVQAARAGDLPASPSLNDDEKLVATYLADQLAKADFVLLDKKTGELVIVEQGEIYRAPALWGKKSGDDDGKGKGYTPAKIYWLSLSNDDIHVVFWGDRDPDALAIHTVKNVKGQRRPQRLISSNLSDRHISNGCVNVGPETTKALYAMMDRRQYKDVRISINPETYEPTFRTIGIPFIVMPEKGDIGAFLDRLPKSKPNIMYGETGQGAAPSPAP